MARVRIDRDDELEGLVTLTLDRPEKLNALDVTLHDELQAALVALETDHAARVVVLVGEGRAFSAGAELGSRRESRPVNDIDRRARAHLGGRTCELIDRLPQVTIGVANGLAIGGGAVLLSCCDLRLAAESAWFSIPEVELDLPLTWQALPRLMRELGPARTKELVMACERFTAADAERWGFVNHVHPDAELPAATRALAARLLSMDPLALASTKAACAALANAMVPKEVTWSDAEMMLLAYRQAALAPATRADRLTLATLWRLLGKTVRWGLATGALTVLAACSSAQAADRPPVVSIGAELPGSETLAAAAADRAATLCEAGADAVEPDTHAYDQETWAEVTELVGRAPIATGDGDPAAARAQALDEVRSGWQGDFAIGDDGWDHTETATVDCPDGHLYAVQVLARAPVRADAGTYGRLRHPANAIEHREALTYGTAIDADGQPVDLLLDLFLPPASQSDLAGRPTLVLVHGGGFAAGSRTQHEEDALAYARRGFVVATIDYRIDPDAGDSVTAHRAAAFAALDDGIESIRWLRARAGSLGIDPDRIAALGASAGGEIALGLALLEDLTPGGSDDDVSSQVTAAFSTGAYLTPVLGAASLEADDAPVLLHHFETDTMSGRPWTYAAATCDAVRSAGGTCDLAIGEGRDHIVGLGPSSAEIDRILAFLAVHLRLDG